MLRVGWRWAAAALVGASLVPVGLVQGSVRGETRIDAAEAVRIALERNPNLEAARLGVAEADQERTIARSMFLPRLNVNHTYLKTDQPVAAFGTLLNQAGFTMAHFAPELLNDPEAIQDHHTQLEIQQPVFNGGMQWMGLGMARTGGLVARAMAAEAESQIVFHVLKTYYDVILTREGLEVADEAVRMAEASVEMIQELHREGMVVRSDLLSAEVQLAGFRQDHLRAGNNFVLARMGLNLLLGDPTGDYSPAERFGDATCPSLDPEELRQRARESRPELTRLRHELELANQQRKMDRAGFLPRLNLQATWDLHGEEIGDGDESYMLAAAFQWNLFNGLGDRARTRKALRGQERTARQLTALEQQVELEVEQARLELQVAAEQVQVAEGAVAQAQEGLGIIRSRYEQGMTTVVDLLGAQLALSAARMDRLQAQHSLWVGRAALCRATGSIIETWTATEVGA